MGQATKWGSKLGLLAIAAFSVTGCASAQHPVEKSRIAHRYEGAMMVVLPRACITNRSVPRHHLYERPDEPRTSADTVPPAKTTRLQALLDGLEPRESGPGEVGPRAEAQCSPVDPSLADVRATPAAVQAMHDRGATHLIVLELHTVLACAASEPWSPNDTCIEDEVTLSALMFDELGVAVWEITQPVLDTDDPGSALDHVLERVPTAEPLRRTRGEFEVAGAAPHPTL